MSLSALRSDTIRRTGVFKKRHVIKGFLLDRTFRPVITLRLCQHTFNGSAPLKFIHPVFRFLHRWACQKAGMDFPWKTLIGSGFSIVHGWSLVVNSNAKIGRNVTFFHGVTIGRRDKLEKDGYNAAEYPTIEDEVWLGPHVTIVGGITIGKGSRVAAGAFVTQNIPAYSMVVGNPAAVVKSNILPDVYNPAP
ncbi:MAG: serine acetyltransferase [Flavitalea sp.]